ncbi:MAG: glycoside hydrolase family 25 domain-containing protein [Bacilli bacterium]
MSQSTKGHIVLSPELAAVTTYYGSDGSGSGNSCGNHFYIGELGGGTTIGAGSQCGVQVSAGAFNDTLAKSVKDTTGFTYGYWFLVGPHFYDFCKGATTTAEANSWGVHQANQAISAWENQLLVNGVTIFADVEQQDLYWKDSAGVINQSLNQAVLEGFISTLTSPNNGLIAGVYSAPCAWEAIMGSYTLPSTVVVWTSELSFSSNPNLTNCISWSVEDNASCNSSTASAQGFGGRTPTIWQYYISPPTSTPLDLDVASAMPS